MTDDRKYQFYSKKKQRAFEDLCRRCGACCGALDDPCGNLEESVDGTYLCREYNNRLGPQRTVSGGTFNCVSIREHIKNNSLRDGCSYKSG